MTEHERDRLTKLEVTSTQMAQDIHQIRLTVEHLREAFHMGRGAAFAVVKLGGGFIRRHRPGCLGHGTFASLVKIGVGDCQ